MFSATLLEDAGISVSLTITPGQMVAASGDPSLPSPPGWGSGGFTVEEHGSLSLTAILVQGAITVSSGGRLDAVDVAVEGALIVGGGAASLTDWMPDRCVCPPDDERRRLADPDLDGRAGCRAGCGAA